MPHVENKTRKNYDEQDEAEGGEGRGEDEMKRKKK